MHLFNILYGFSQDIYLAIRTAIVPTLRAVIARPSLVLTPRRVSRVFMDALWSEWGPGSDAAARGTKARLLGGGKARGVVMDVGAGHGHLAHYLDRRLVTTYVALEPNVLMHPRIRKAANECNFLEDDGSLLVLPFGAEETDKIQHALVKHHALNPSSPPLAQGQATTLVAILSFCSVPDAPSSIAALVSHVLAPGGTLLFYEHVMNPIGSIALCQRVLGKIWAVFFDGCVLGQDTVAMVRRAADGCGGWESVEIGGKDEGDDVESLFTHATGVCVKRG